jgi:heat shock protein HtpX
MFMNNLHRLNNDKISVVFQTILILGAMAALTALIGYRLFGSSALIFAGVFGAGIIIAAPKISPKMLLSSRQVRTLRYHDAPEVFSAVSDFSNRAGLSGSPSLGYIASPVPNAFTVGDRRDSAIILSRGLFERLTPRELNAVIAHEIAHIRNGDLRLIGLADAVRRVTTLMSRAGLFVFMFSLPLYLFSNAYSFPGMLILLLLAAPTVSMLLQFALSRGREFSADAGAAELTGDPIALASALKSIAYQGNRFLDYFFPVRRSEQSSLFRTHPATEERIRRLQSMAQDRALHYRR